MAYDSVFIDSVLINSDTSSINNYIIKINKNGVLEWVIPLCQSKGTATNIKAINIDLRGDLYVSGNTVPVIDSFPNIYLLNYGNIQAGTASAQGVFFAKISPPHSESITICAGDSFYFGGAFHSAAGIYYDTLHIDAGVDSTITLTLFVDFISLSLTQNNDTLYAAMGAASYQWLNCDSNIIYNNNNSFFVPPHSGNYAAIIHHGNCIDTTACTYFSATLIENLFDGTGVFISPNPVTSEISITFQKQNIKQATITIKNILGQTVFLKEIKTPEKETKVDLSFLEKGIYLVEVMADGERMVRKAVKE